MNSTCKSQKPFLIWFALDSEFRSHQWLDFNRTHENCSVNQQSSRMYFSFQHLDSETSCEKGHMTLNESQGCFFFFRPFLLFWFWFFGFWFKSYPAAGLWIIQVILPKCEIFHSSTCCSKEPCSFQDWLFQLPAAPDKPFQWLLMVLTMASSASRVLSYIRLSQHITPAF